MNWNDNITHWRSLTPGDSSGCFLKPSNYVRKIVMPSTPSKPLFSISVPKQTAHVSKATVSSVLSRPRPTTAQALKGYDYLKSHSSRGSSGS
jgi:hypothetical protein